MKLSLGIHLFGNPLSQSCWCNSGTTGMEQLLLNVLFTHLVELKMLSFLSINTEFLLMIMHIFSPRYLKSPNLRFCLKRWRSWTSGRFTTSQWFTLIRRSTPRSASSWIRESPHFLWWMKMVINMFTCIQNTLYFYIVNGFVFSFPSHLIIVSPSRLCRQDMWLTSIPSLML